MTAPAQALTLTGAAEHLWLAFGPGEELTLAVTDGTLTVADADGRVRLAVRLPLGRLAAGREFTSKLAEIVEAADASEGSPEVADPWCFLTAAVLSAGDGGLTLS